MDMPQTTATLGIAVLAAHFDYVLRTVPDAERDGDELAAVVTTILCREPTSRDDVLSLIIALRSELDPANVQWDDVPEDALNLVARLHRAADAIVRGLIRHAGADSPMVCPWVDKAN